jgi:hypothetical protein
MITQDLTEQLRLEVKRLKEVQEQFLVTYTRLCVHHGGEKWREKEIERVFHHVRKEIIPIMEQAGMEPKAVQALCSWAETLIMRQ